MCDSYLLKLVFASQENILLKPSSLTALGDKKMSCWALSIVTMVTLWPSFSPTLFMSSIFKTISLDITSIENFLGLIDPEECITKTGTWMFDFSNLF